MLNREIQIVLYRVVIVIASIVIPYSTAFGQPQRNVSRDESEIFARYDSLVNWPVVESAGRLFDDTVSIIGGAPSQGAGDERCLLTYAAEALRAWDAVTLEPRWSEPVRCPYQPRLIRNVEGRLVLATPYALFALSGDDGRSIWRVRVDGSSEDAEDLVDAPRWQLIAADDRVVIAIDSEDAMRCMDSASGGLRWQVDAGAERFNAMEITGDRLVAVVRGDDGVVASVRSLADGREIGRVPMASDAAEWDVFRVAGGCVVRSSQALVSIDVAAARERWRYQFEPSPARRLSANDDFRFVWADSGGIVRCIDLSTGRVVWEKENQGATDAEFAVLADNDRRVVFGGPETLVCSKAETGEMSWRRSGRALPIAQSPMVIDRDLLIVQALDGDSGRGAAGDAGRRYLVRRIDTRTGMTKSATSHGDLVIGPVTQFGGVFAFRDALAALDGPRLIGYVSARAEAIRRKQK